MPKGTAVHRCVQKVKKSGKGVNPYAVCQKATGQSYATGKSLKSHMPSGVDQSPKGNIADHRLRELSGAIHRKIKNAGSWDNPASYLPYHPEPMVRDPGVPADKVC